MNTSDRSVSARRRVLNIIWTAAGEYGFEPSFLAFTQDGQPDLYMNSIIGYVHKWYDSPVLRELFDTVGGSLLRETLDGVLWIGLENCAFEREVRDRPVLAELRASCAESFFRQQFYKSRQQWMAQNSLVYALQSARWNTVLKREPGLVNPWEKNLFHELSYSGDWSAQEIAEHTYDIFRRYFRLGQGGTLRPFLNRVRGAFAKTASRALPSRVMRAEELTFASGSSGPGMITARRARNTGPISAAEEENNRIYIENCFGLPLYSREEHARIEDALCTDRHAECHLYFACGERPLDASSDPLIQKTIRGAQAQAEQNRSHYRERRHFYQNSILRLTEQIRNALLVYPQPSRVLSRFGQLDPTVIWRALYLNDDRVFTEVFQEEHPDFSVDLMLDASASRLQSQEMIAAQAYVIARSLRLCGIPVQVSSFLSIRGYTVMRRHCSYDQTKDDDKIFDYFAAGWNRDGLALRQAGRLMEDSPAKKRLLIVLTDASPNDDRRIPGSREEGHLMSRDYSGEAGIEDTAREVRALRKRGVHVMAVLNGEDGSTEAARRIYGEDFTRIQSIRDLSRAVGMLLQKQIEKMRS